MRKGVGMRQKMAKYRVIALALTWDGARWPTRSLSPQARAFLLGKAKARTSPAPPPAEMAALLALDRVRELRICWVPRLAGGANTLTNPFASENGKRIVFQAGKPLLFGDALGVVYKRTHPHPSS